MTDKYVPIATRIRRMVFIQTVAIILLFIAAGALGALLVLERSERAAADHAEEIDERDENAEQVERCYRSIGSSLQTIGVLRGLEVVLENQVAGAKAIIAANPGDPANASRRRIIKRAQPALEDTRDFIATIESTRPTSRDCAALRCRLDRQRTGDPPTPRCQELLRERRNP